MLIAGNVAIDVQGLREQLAGAFWIALGIQHEVRVLKQDVGGFGRGRYIAVLSKRERLLYVRFRTDETPGIGLRLSQISQCRSELAVVDGTRLAADADGLLQQRKGGFALSLPPVGEADALEKLGPDLGLQGRVGLYFFSALGEQVLGGVLLALRLERIRAREHIDHESRHLLRPIALLDRGVACHFKAVILPKRHAGDDHQAQEQGRRGQDRQQVAPQELDGVIAPIALARSYRLACKVPAQIFGERFDG